MAPVDRELVARRVVARPAAIVVVGLPVAVAPAVGAVVTELVVVVTAAGVETVAGAATPPIPSA
jgi:hypothetical protein